MSSTSAIRRLALLVACAATSAALLVAPAPAAAQDPNAPFRTPAAPVDGTVPPPDAVRRCVEFKVPEVGVPAAWCKAVTENQGIQKCTGPAYPAAESLPFPAGCTIQYRRLHPVCTNSSKLGPEEGWVCRQFRQAWQGKHPPPLTGAVPDPGIEPYKDAGRQPLAVPDTSGPFGTSALSPSDDMGGLVGGGPGNALTGTSDFCRRKDLDAKARASCQRAGSIARSYPLWSYGLDNQIRGVPIEIGKNVGAALNSAIVMIWAFLLFAVNGVLVMIDWAFSFDLVNSSMAGVAQGLYALNTDVLGSWWMSLGLAVAALTGIWTGLVRRRTTQTMTELGATLALMIVALAIIHHPQETVGDLSKQVNEASLGAWSLAAKGSVKEPSGAFANSSRQMFDTLVLRPWCAMQFGDVGFCMKKITSTCRIEERAWIAPDGDPICDVKAPTIADAWLSAPANSQKRAQLWAYLNEKDKPHAELMGSADAVPARAALMLMIAIGMLGGALLIGGLGLGLLAAAVEALILLLIAPAMLIAPAFGEAGRRAMLTYLKRLAVALGRKFIYAIGLAIVVLIATIIAGLPNMSFGANWLMLDVYWWGVLLRRRQIFDFLTPGGGGKGGMLALAGMAMGARMAVRSGTQATRGVMGMMGRRRDAVGGALAADARNQIGTRAMHAVGRRKGAEQHHAAGVVDRARAARARLGTLDGEQAGRRQQLGQARGARHGAGTELRDAEGKLADIDREHGALAGRRQGADGYIEQLGAERDAAREELVGATGERRDELQTSIDGYDGKISAAEQRRGEIDAELAGLEDRRRTAVNEMSGPAAAWHTADQQVQELTQAVANADM
jgi:hypothetical protein